MNLSLQIFFTIQFLIVGMLETVHSVDTATLGGLGGIPLYVFSTATSFKESLFFLLRFERFIIKNMFCYFIFNCRHVRDCTFCGYCYLWWSWWYSSLCLLNSYAFYKKLIFRSQVWTLHSQKYVLQFHYRSSFLKMKWNNFLTSIYNSIT